MEDAPEMVAEPTGQILDGDLRHQVQVEFGPYPGQRPGEDLSAVIRRMVHQVVSSVDARERCEQGRIVAGPGGDLAGGPAALHPQGEPPGPGPPLGNEGPHQPADGLADRATRPPEPLPPGAPLRPW